MICMARERPMTEPPRIGVTRWADVPDEARDRYWSRVKEAGGDVIDLDESQRDNIAQLAPTLDALMLTGGIDVDPAVYGAERHAKVKEVDRTRDEMEIGYLLAALQRDIPVLAICRGHQVLNVGFGGTLLQHIDSGEHRADFATPGYPSRWHQLSLLGGSRLADAFGEATLEINSRHHQAVRKSELAPGLRPVAFADEHGDELIEGMESEQHRWVVGVQWHPERPELHRPEFHRLQKRLFAAFIEQARLTRT
jgi:putative glutamine amidotransferase